MKKAHERLKLEHELLKKAIEFTSQTKSDIFEFIEAQEPRTR